jgi:membrane-associated protease RseP (regulator of RpoE activity)
MSYPDLDVLNSQVSRIFRIDDVTAGNPREWIVRYRGQLLGDDSAAAYDQLADAMRPYGITPLFRKGEDGRQIIFLAPTMQIPKPSARATLNILLFVLTILSMMFTAVDISPEVASTLDGPAFLFYKLEHLLTGWPFALSMMGILFAHEMGHYIACRYYKIPATLPFFIPAPDLSPLGTFGAFIAMRGIPKNKRILFDVGVAGPLAGLVIAIPVLLYGLSISHVGPVDHPPAGFSGFLEGNSVFYLFSKFLIFGRLLPAPTSMGNLPSFTYWLQYFFSGHPIPYGGSDVQLHSVALAGWGGLLVTALNLVPVGTLDGGHVAYGLFGERARRIFPAMIGLLIAVSILPVLLTSSFASFNYSWLLWVLILFWLGNVRATPLDDITELDPPRRALGVVVLIVFILLFTPVPMVIY